MNKIIALAIMMMVATSAFGQSNSRTITRTDGSIQHVIPVTEQKCNLQDKANVGNAAIGAGVGYATARVVTNSSRDSGLWGLAGAAAGALIGANTQNEQQCRYEEVLIGHKVITVNKNGKMTETFIPYTGPKK